MYSPAGPLYTRGMALFSDVDRVAAVAIGDLCYANPFLPSRLEAERRALGDAHRSAPDQWGRGSAADNPNIDALGQRARELVTHAARKLRDGHTRSDEDTQLYQGLIRYHLYHRLEDLLLKLAQAHAQGDLDRRRVSSYKLFHDELEKLCDVPGQPLPLGQDTGHLFAMLFQVRRAFDLIRDHILGTSASAGALRGSVWQSIFTHDMRRYERSLYAHMHEIPTLITGPSGTGKELVARAIGMGHYIPFDATELRFSPSAQTAFHGLNISALSSSLLESELFGHRRGAFSGATEDRQGWLELCGRHGCIFLDEIGELDPAVQVKLLRVLQTRSFSRVGETEERAFEGKLIAATHRDLATGMDDQSFRSDFYYRLCADNIETPTLRKQLREAPQDLGHMVKHMTTRIVDEHDREAVAAEVVGFIGDNLADYDWPGNVRELEQCVRSVLVRGGYRPARRRSADPGGARHELATRFTEGELTADQLLDAYCTLMYHFTGSYQEAARRLGVDRRTVKARKDDALLEALDAD